MRRPIKLACWAIRNVILLRGRLSGAVVSPSDLESANPSSSVNGLDCFENLNEFDQLFVKKGVSENLKKIHDPVFRFQEFSV